jgi:hypothetical protein
LADAMGHAKGEAANRAKGGAPFILSVSSGGIPAVRWS